MLGIFLMLFVAVTYALAFLGVLLSWAVQLQDGGQAVDQLVALGRYWFSTVIPYGTLSSIILAALEAWSYAWWPESRFYKSLRIINDLVSRLLALNIRDVIAPRTRKTREEDKTDQPQGG